MKRQSNCHALIVEDDPASREPLATYLRRRGYEVRCAATVAAARSKLTADVTHLILDLRLPDGLGLSLLAWAREHGLAVKVAVVTGLDWDDVSADGLAMHPEAYLRKPVDYGELVEWLEGTRRAGTDPSPLLPRARLAGLAGPASLTHHMRQNHRRLRNTAPR